MTTRRTRRSTAGAIAVIGALALSSCAGAGAGGGTAEADADEINVLMVNNPQMVDLQQLTQENFTAETGIDVNFTVLPENDVRDKISQEFSSQAGQYDVATLSNFEIPIYARSEWIAPLDDYVENDSAFDQDDVLGPLTESLSGDDGRLYGEPFYGESSFLMYRKDVLDAAGIEMPDDPTWQEVADIAAQVDGAEPGMAGICLRGQPGWGQLFAPLTTVVSGAKTCPQPGWPRRQMPAIPGSAPSICAAMSATSCHVGLSGIWMPAASRTSFLYIRNEDSP